MDEEKLDPELRGAIIAYFDGWELVEFLRIPIEDVVDLLEDYVIDSSREIAEFIDYETDDEYEDNGDE